MGSDYFWLMFPRGKYEFGKCAKSDSFFVALVDRTGDLTLCSKDDSSNFLAILGSAEDMVRLKRLVLRGSSEKILQ